MDILITLVSSFVASCTLVLLFMSYDRLKDKKRFSFKTFLIRVFIVQILLLTINLIKSTLLT